MSMWWDLSVQGLIWGVSILMFLWVNDHPRKLLNRYHSYRDRNKHQSRRHFVKAAELLSKASSYPRSSPQSLSLASSSASEADSAVKLDPKDAANHILLSMALDLQGFHSSALEAINVALSPLASPSLSDHEKSDALVKRARMRLHLDASAWSAVENDLKVAVALNKGSHHAWSLLGDCYQALGSIDLAANAFQEALLLNPDSLQPLHST